MYTTDSTEAHSMIREDPEVFEEYHTGFRSQCSSWPSNPVTHYEALLSNFPPGTVIADLGCGDAALAKALSPKGYNVLSYDLVSNDPFVVEADICRRIPLPGGEDNDGTDGSGQIVDVCVCSLSLMSKNWVSCLREVRRVLKAGGKLEIAEVTSRVSDMKAFVELLKDIGFELISKDTSNTHFVLFSFRKSTRSARSEKQWKQLVERGSLLKPCEYKRR